MPKPKKILSVIIDESGSMAGRTREVNEGYESFIKEMKTEEDLDIRLTVTKFNTRSEVLFSDKSVKRSKGAAELTYRPNGGTALLDAVGKTIQAIDADIARMRNKPTILVVVMTDGQENSSTDFKHAQLKEMIQQREDVDKNWSFLFMGADLKDWSDANSLGIAAGNTQSYRSVETVTVFTQLGANAKAYYKSGERSTKAFFAPQSQDEDEQDTVVTSGTSSAP